MREARLSHVSHQPGCRRGKNRRARGHAKRNKQRRKKEKDTTEYPRMWDDDRGATGGAGGREERTGGRWGAPGERRTHRREIRGDDRGGFSTARDGCQIAGPGSSENARRDKYVKNDNQVYF